jgi:hypothetical protein
MDKRKVYKQKAEAEIELMKARLTVLRALAKKKIAEGRIEYAKHLEDIEENLQKFNEQLKEMSSLTGDAWQRVKDSAETSWAYLKSVIDDFANRFKDKGEK